VAEEVVRAIAGVQAVRLLLLVSVSAALEMGVAAAYMAVAQVEEP
jgi:hypothetical protein